MVYGCVALYLLLAAYHVYGHGREWHTKPLLAPMAAVCHIAAAETPDLRLLIALALCCAGDTLLMLRGKRTFVLGGCCFLGAHLALGALYALRLPRGFGVIAAAAAAFAPLFACGIAVVRKSGVGRRTLWIVYLAVNALVCSTALVRALFTGGGVPALAGAALFFASDCLLCYRLAHKLKSHHAVMETYTLALLLIALGAA